MIIPQYTAKIGAFKMVFYWYCAGYGKGKLGSSFAVPYHDTRKTFRRVRNG